MIRSSVFYFSLTLFCAPSVWAGGNCADLWSHSGPPRLAAHESVFYTNPNEQSINPEYREAVQKIFAPNGVAQQLGLALPPHILEFLTPSQLAALAVHGRHPVAHWKEGLDLARSFGKRSGIMEFVLPGCDTCRSFYSSATSFAQQIAILFHVAGHNDFSAHSMYHAIRRGDAIAASLRLHKKLQELYQTVGEPEVATFFQWLLSAAHLQDMVRGSFDHPDRFAIPQKATDRYPSRSLSVLQSLKHHLSPYEPAWKREIIELYEEVHRGYGYVPPTKMMNEGWATLMQIILAEYAEWKTDENIIEFADLLRGAGGSPRYPNGAWNPYWLGLEAWKRLRERFNQDPVNQSLSKIERDRKFIAYAHRLIEVERDVHFLPMALDAEWVSRYNLFLFRKAEAHEIDPNLERSKDPEKTQQNIVISRDPKRVVQVIAMEASPLQFQVPLIALIHPDGMGRGVFLMRHVSELGIPLVPETIGPTLYTYAKVLGRTVSLITSDSEYRVEVQKNGEILIFKGKYEFDDYKKWEEIRIEATEWTEAVSNGLKEFIESEVLDAEWMKSAPANGVDFSQLKFPENWNLNVTAAHLGATEVMLGDWARTPTVGASLEALRTFIQARLLRATQHSLKNGKPNKTAQGVQIKIFPEIPMFQMDVETWKNTQTEKNGVAPIDPEVALQFTTGNGNLRHFETQLAGDFDADLGAGPHDRGRRFWGKAGGKGQGSGKGKGQKPSPGEPGDQPGNQAGTGDGTEIVIPFKEYGKLLAANVNLPNLEPKDGQDVREMDRMRTGSIRKPEGEVRYDRVVVEAEILGRRSLKLKGFPDSAITRKMAFQEGLKLLSPDEYFRKDFVSEPRPVTRAVVVIAMDSSGSMQSHFESLRSFLYDVKAILSARYEGGVEFRFVSFSGEAVEVAEKKFFETFIGGGTNYESAVIKTKEVIEAFPRTQYDRFMFLAGDYECMQPQRSMDTILKLAPELSFSGFVFTPNMMGGAGLFDLLGAEVKKRTDMGSTILKPGEPYNPIDKLKELFKNTR